MAGYVNTTKGLFIMPGGIEAVPGVDVDIDVDTVENASVAAWIADGRLVEASKYAPVAADTIDGLRTQIADLTSISEKLVAENADLVAKVAALQADLEAATAPKAPVAPKK